MSRDGSGPLSKEYALGGMPDSSKAVSSSSAVLCDPAPCRQCGAVRDSPGEPEQPKFGWSRDCARSPGRDPSAQQNACAPIDASLSKSLSRERRRCSAGSDPWMELPDGRFPGMVKADYSPNTVESAVSCAAHGFKTLPPYEGGTIVSGPKGALGDFTRKTRPSRRGRLVRMLLV